MRLDARLTPGLLRLVCGAACLGFSTGRLTSGPRSETWWPWPELAALAVGAGLTAWGWMVFRRARATDPDPERRRWLPDAIAVVVFAFLPPLWLTLPPGVRDGVAKTFQVVTEATSAAQGGF